MVSHHISRLVKQHSRSYLPVILFISKKVRTKLFLLQMQVANHFGWEISVVRVSELRSQVFSAWGVISLWLVWHISLPFNQLGILSRRAVLLLHLHAGVWIKVSLVELILYFKIDYASYTCVPCFSYSELKEVSLSHTLNHNVIWISNWPKV